MYLGPILVDTVILSEAAGRATSKDVTVAERLEQRMGGIVNRKKVFDEIQHAKLDIAGENVISQLKLQPQC